jgi:basic membrane lipoprotein Med (substrate-binding protein (PBP1-ABC) superfamily)
MVSLPPNLLLILLLFLLLLASPALSIPVTVHFVITQNSVLDDGGFNMMAAAALEKLSIDPLVDLTWNVTAYPGDGDDGPSLAHIDAVIGQAGSNPSNTLFLALGFEHDNWIALAAAANPDYYFVEVDSCPASKSSLTNVVCVLFQEDQVAFAAGYVAASATKTGAVGGVFGTPLPALLRFESGFKAGARAKKPDVVVETQFIHDFASLDKGASVAEFMVTDRNVDVIFGAAGGTSIGALNWCLANEVMAIGVDADQFLSVYAGDTDANPNLSFLLTSAQKAVDVSVERVVREFIYGSIEESAAISQYTFDYSNAGVRLSDCHLSCDRLSLSQWTEISSVESRLSVGLVKTGISAVTNALDLYSEKDHPKYTWSSVDSYAEPPSVRYNSANAVVTDPNHGTAVMLLFGGTNENAISEGDIWEYTVYGEQWQVHDSANGLNSGGYLLAGDDGFSTPSARSGARMAQVAVASYGCCGDGGSAFMWGGWETDAGYMDDAWVFTRDQSWFPASSQWTKLPPVAGGPTARRDHCMASVGGKTFMFGGKDTDSLRSDFWVHDFSAGELAGNETEHSWAELTKPHGAMEGRMGAQMLSHDGKVYLLGGEDFTGNVFDDFWVYDSEAAAWSQLENSPTPLSFGNLAFVNLEYRGGSIFAVGGKSSANSISQQIHVYDIDSGSWSESSQTAAVSAAVDVGCGGESESADEAAAKVDEFAKYVHSAAGVATSSGVILQFGGVVGTEISSSMTVFVTGDRKCTEKDAAYKVGSRGGSITSDGAAASVISFVEGECNAEAKYEKVWYWIGHEDGSPPECVVGSDEGDFQLPETIKSIDCEYVPSGSSQATLIVALTVAGVVVCIIVGCFVLVNSQKPIFVLSQVPFLGLSIFGALLMCLSNFTQLGKNTNSSCMMKVFAYNISFTLMFAPLFAKTYRIHRLLNNKRLRKVEVTLRKIMSLVAIIVAVEVGIMVVWFFVDPLMAVVETNLEYGFSYTVCGYSHGGQIGLLNVFYKGFVIAMGCGISWETRNYDKFIAEGKFVMASMYQMALLGVVVGTIMALGVTATVAATVQSFTGVVGSISLVLLVIVPKFKKLKMSGSEIMEEARNASNTSTNTSNGSNSSSDEGSKEELRGRISELEREMEELRRGGEGS